MSLDVSDSQESLNVPSSAPDPYASKQDSDSLEQGIPFAISMSSLPNGLPILGPLTGYTPQRLARNIHFRRDKISSRIKRPLTPEELTAVAYHTAKGFAIGSYGPTLGFTAASYRIYATRDEFRFPFAGALKSEGSKRGLSWDGEHLRLVGNEILKQFSKDFKTRLLHFTRGFIYLSFGLAVVPAFLTSYGLSVSAVGQMRDPRLSTVNKVLTSTLRGEADERRSNSKETSETRENRRRTRDRTEQENRDAGLGFPAQRRGRSTVDDDDMSPTGGGIGFNDDEDMKLSSAVNSSGYSSGDREFREQGTREQPKAGMRSTPKSMSNDGRPSDFQHSKPTRQFEDTADDESLTSGAGIDSSTTGSAWERIRQQSTSDSSKSTGSRSWAERKSQARRKRDGDDNFMFSSEEQERNYARDEAQRQFDERVERERRGGDFGGGGGGDEGRGSGWRR